MKLESNRSYDGENEPGLGRDTTGKGFVFSVSMVSLDDLPDEQSA